MCGIAGFVGEFGTERPAALRRMTDAIAHRGPDGEGGFDDGRAALGHRRLAIIDLTDQAAQPMTGPSGAVIVFNGEIYNYLELRSELEAAGERFVSHSDTEVLLRLYERRGPAALDRLIGMFALAIWDPGRGRLFLARDRLGKKPLYYWHDGTRLAFASEIKALLALPEIAASVSPNPCAVSDFLSLGYILGPKTAFSNIHRLPPAHCAHFDPRSGHLETSEYWRLEEFYLTERLGSGPGVQDEFLGLVEDAVRLRLRSDVPVGIFLSGGVDSSAIAALVSKVRPQGGAQAFCVGFNEAGYDESIHAAHVAEHLGIPLTRLEQPLPEADLVRRLVWHCDEPFADTSMMPTYVLNRAARRHVTVALTGDGADELLAGYPTYRADQLYHLTRHLPEALTGALSRAAERWLKPRYRKVGWDYKLRQYLRCHGNSRERAHYAWREVYSEAEKRTLMGADLSRACAGYDPFDSFADAFAKVRGAPFLDRSLFVDAKTWLADDILVKADRMSMAASLEVRSPFLDHRVVEFCARLPVCAKMTLRRQKAMLKTAMEPSLPAAILDRRKSGFNAPTRALSCDRLDAGRLAPLFRPEFRLDATREDVTFKSFSLAVLGPWLQLFAGLSQSGRWEY